MFGDVGDFHCIAKPAGFADLDVEHVGGTGADNGFGIVRTETTFVSLNGNVDGLTHLGHAGQVPRFAGLFEEFEADVIFLGKPAQLDGFVGRVTAVGVGAEGDLRAHGLPDGAQAFGVICREAADLRFEGADVLLHVLEAFVGHVVR